MTDPARLAHLDRLFIGGAWVAPALAGMIEIVSPDTEQIVERVAEASEQDMIRAVAAARDAFDHGPWPRLPPARRIALLHGMADLLEARHEELARLWSLQMGGPIGIAPFMVAGGTATFRSSLACAASFAFEQRVASPAAAATLLIHEPVGVVAAIAPWNAPYSLMVNKIAPALAAGCTLVMKPAPETPLEAYIIAECAEAAGLPPGVLNLVASHRAAADHLVRNPDVDKVSFTGSTATGHHIAAICAARMARCTLELGGKSAAIVLADFPVDEAAAILTRTITLLSGQVCSVLSRALVPRDRHDAIASAVASQMAAVRIGHSDDPAAQMGPIASRRQLERIEAYVAKGVEEGATLVTGGNRPAHPDRGCFIAPTLFSNVDNRMSIAREEIFGPVLCLIPYADEEDAIRLANESIYGLNGAVLTRNAEAAYRIGRRIRSGRFGQNGIRADGSLPSGGFKQSGIGREGGQAGLLAYLETKVLFLDEMPAQVPA